MTDQNATGIRTVAANRRTELMGATLLTTGALGLLVCVNGMMTEHVVRKLDLVIGSGLLTLAVGFAVYFYA